ncbi:MAG: glycosyltransferase family 2 protein [Clostridia bacterium]|nr:glycosyltransferase family 2 protein [Clostridia bacterium]
MKFSILIPVYNTEKYLDSCIKSVKKQTYSDFEAIIVDDGSEATCANLCDELVKNDNRFTVIHQKNKGLYMARCAGAKEAKGDYIIFLDSDDYIEPNMLNELYNTINNNEFPDIVLFDSNVVDENNNIISQRNCNISDQKEITVREILKDMIVSDRFNPIWMKCVKRINYKPSDKYIGINMAEDVINTVQILKESKKIIYRSLNLYNYRKNSVSITHNINIKHLYQSCVANDLLYSSLLDTFGKDSKEIVLFRKKFIKGLIWYVTQIDNKCFVDNKDIVNNVKKTVLFESCLNNKSNIFYYIIITMFNKNHFRLIKTIGKIYNALLKKN